MGKHTKKIWIRRRYFLSQNHFTQCFFALQQTKVYDVSEGDQCPCCETGHVTYSGAEFNVKFLVIIFCLSVGGVLVVILGVKVIFPEPLTGYTFVQDHIKVNELDSILELKISRKSGALRRAEIDYAIVEETAKRGADFFVQGDFGHIIFAAGQRSSVLRFTLVQDQEYDEGVESFRVRLLNIKGQPEAIVSIQDQAISVREADAELAASMVYKGSLALHIVAKEVRRTEALRTLHAFYTKNRSKADLDETEKKLSINAANIQSAQKDYEHAIVTLSNLHLLAVEDAFMRRVEELSIIEHIQLQRATEFLRQHLDLYLETSRILWRDLMADVEEII